MFVIDFWAASNLFVVDVWAASNLFVVVVFGLWVADCRSYWAEYAATFVVFVVGWGEGVAAVVDTAFY